MLVADHLADAVDDARRALDRARGMAVEILVRSLPLLGPATALVGDIVGVRTRHDDLAALVQRQDVAVVLEQHQRLAHGAPGQVAMFPRSHRAGTGRRTERLVEQPEPELHLQDARDRVVDPRHRHLAGLGEADHLGQAALPGLYEHEHVDAGVEGLLVGQAGTPYSLPVGDDHAVEAQFGLQQVGQQAPRAMDLLAIDGAEGRHDRDGAAVDRVDEARQVHRAELGVGDGGVAAVHAAIRRAVGDEVLRRRADPVVGRRVLALVTVDQRAGEHPLQLDVLAEGLVGPAPADVPRHRDGRRERPANAGRRQFPGRDPGKLRDEFRVARCAEPDVVRKDHGVAVEVGVAVHRIDADHDRNAGARLQRRLVVGIEEFPPRGGRSTITRRDGVGDGTQPVLADVVRGRGRHVRLHHLPHFLRDGHRGDGRGYVGLRPQRYAPGSQWMTDRRRRRAGACRQCPAGGAGIGQHELAATGCHGNRQDQDGALSQEVHPGSVSSTSGASRTGCPASLPGTG